MKILLLLVLKCLLYLKITGYHVYQSEIQVISSENIEHDRNSVVEYSTEQCIRVKRDLPIHNPSIFELSEPPRSARRKRADLTKKNQIFFRRHKKKQERKSKIRKSLFRRGKFTTSTPYRNRMRRYVRGKGKIVRPPGLKYRKRYRFNTFKKTQDVALGLGGDGMAQFKKSAPKKRAPIHVRDYERGRRTRKAFRGRVGERKSPDDDRRRAIIEDRANQRRARVAAKVRKTDHKSKEYYDESGDYDEDSLPKQTKARKSQGAFGKTTKWKKIVTPLKIKDSNFEYSSEDNTLWLSDGDQLTDISSEIEAQRSEFSDEKPKHRKNASSSEYDQYSFADDDSAIVKGEVVSSKEESEQRVSFPRKSTILGPVKYAQYDLNKLDASMERVFKKKKAKNKIEAKVGQDDPWENPEDAYKDESSYDESSETKDEKEKGKKSKTQVKKVQGKTKLSLKNQHKPKSGKTKTKSETDHEEYSFDESGEYDDAESEKYDDDGSEEYDEEGSQEYDDDGSEEYDEEGSEEYDDDGSEEYEDEDYDDKSTSKDSRVSYEDVEATSIEDETSSKKNKTTSVDKKAISEKKHSKGKSSNETEEYSSEYESDEYSTYEETTPPIRRIPTWKITQYSTLEKFYEEYTDSDDETKSKPDLKTKIGLPGKTTSKVKQSSKKGHDTSTYESEEYYSEEYSDSKSSREGKNKQNKITKSEKKSKTKSDVKKNQDDSEYSSHYYDSSEYSDSESLKKGSKSQKAKTSGKSSKIDPIIKSNRKETHISSEFSSHYDSSEYTDSESQKKGSSKSVPKSQKTTSPGKMSSKTDMTPKSDPKERQLSSELSSHYYDSSESSDENYSEKKASKKEPLESGKKSKTSSRKMPPKIASTSSRKISPKFATTPRKKSKTEPAKTKLAPEKNKPTSEFSSDYYDSETSNEHHSDQSIRKKDSPPSKKIHKISTDLSDSDYSDE